jgi:ribose transport system substrate-binding protein
MALSGCGNGGNEAQTTAVNNDTTQTASTETAAPAQVTVLTTAELDKVAKSAKPYSMALVVKTRNNPFFSPMISNAESESKKLATPLEVQAPAQETDKERQFAIVQDLTARKVDAILIAPADSKAIVPALKQAQEKGVVVINLDNRVDAETASAAGLKLGGYVGADNEEGGQMAGAALAKALGGQGKVAVLEGIRGADNAEARKRGFTQGAKGLEIAASESAEWDTQKAYSKMQSILAANPDLKGVFCANDKMALGAIKAIRESGKKGKITVVGYDNIPDVQPYLKSGEMYATIDQNPDLMGKYGARMAAGVLNKTVQPGGELLVPLQLITKDKAR